MLAACFAALCRDVPVELIEWQPARAQSDAVGLSGGSWSANWQVTLSSKVRYLHRKLRDIGAVPRRVGAGGGPATGPSTSTDGAGSVRGILVKDSVSAKAIVFTQFHQHHSLISQHLTNHHVSSGAS